MLVHRICKMTSGRTLLETVAETRRDASVERMLNDGNNETRTASDVSGGLSGAADALCDVNGGVGPWDLL